MTKVERIRFNINDDLVLLREIVYLNPYDDKSRWNMVQENVCRESQKMFTVRAVREHTEHLLKLFRREDVANLRRSGSKEQYEEKEKLLQEILDMTQEYRDIKKYKEPDNKEIGFRVSAAITEDEQNINSSHEDIKMDALETESFDINTATLNDQNETSNEYSFKSFVTQAPKLKSGATKHKQTALHTGLEYLKKSRLLKIEVQRKKQMLEERKLQLEEDKLKFEMKKFELEQKEREARLEMEMEERRCNKDILKQQQNIINYFINKKE